MAGSKKEYHRNFAIWKWARVQGVQADQTILAGPGILGSIQITQAGDSNSTVKVFDGTVAAGTQIGGTIYGASRSSTTYVVYVDDSIHIETVDASEAIDILVRYR